MSRRKLVTQPERTLVRRELAEAESALRRAREATEQEPEQLQDALRARDRLASARSELDRVAEATEGVADSSAFRGLLEVRQASDPTADPGNVTEALSQARERLDSAAGCIDEVDRELAANRPERARRPFEEARRELGAAREQKQEVERRVGELRRQVDESPENDWLDAITALVPVEVVAGWTAIQAIVGTESPTLAAGLYWAVFAVVLVATYLHVRRDVAGTALPFGRPTAGASGGRGREPAADGGGRSADGGGRPVAPSRRVELRVYNRWSDRVQAGLAVGAFVVWVYYLEGPFGVSGLHDPTLAAVLLPLYTLAGVQLVSTYTAMLGGLELRLRRTLESRGGDGAG